MGRVGVRTTRLRFAVESMAEQADAVVETNAEAVDVTIPQSQGEMNGGPKLGPMNPLAVRPANVLPMPQLDARYVDLTSPNKPDPFVYVKIPFRYLAPSKPMATC